MALNADIVIAGPASSLLLSGISAALSPRAKRWAGTLLGSGLLITAAAVLHWNSFLDLSWGAPLGFGAFPLTLHIDPLSACFLFILGTVTSCCALFAADYVPHIAERIQPRIFWPALFLFVTGMASVLVAGDAITFLVAWEVMSLSSAVLVASEFRQHRAQRAAMIYLAATRIATGFLSAGFLLMHSLSHSWSLADWRFDSPQSWLPAGLIAAGLLIKGGVWPFHIWLPHAHPEAPTPVSALMSGVMVKVAVYAMIRLFVVGGLNCLPLIWGIFGLACVSSFWGVLFAINQQELKRLLAYSTVENIGLIFLAVSLSMWARVMGLEEIAMLALAAATLHCISHAWFKTLLFLCAGSVDVGAHSRELSKLGGLARNMPATTASFIVGSAAICALPPLNGFTSKWALYESLFHASMQMQTLAERAVCVAAIGLLSCVGALAIGCFAKAAGVAFLGQARSKAAANSKESPPVALAPLVALSAACMGMGVASQWLSPLLVPMLTSTLSVSSESAQLNLISVLPFALAIAGLAAAAYLTVLRNTPEKYRTWDCGFGSNSPRSQVTADSFAQPIARIFTPVLQHSVSVDISGRDRRHFPEHITVKPSMVSLLETRVYAPIAAAFQHMSRLIARLQAGSIHLYLLYMYVSMILVILLGAFVW